MWIILSGGREPVAEGCPDFEPPRGSSRMGESVVSVRGLTKHFGDICALDGVNLEVKPGIFGFIGPNGAGKTTLLRILLGLIRPNKGSAEVLGFGISSNSLAIRERVGVLHERPVFPGPIRVLEYVRDVVRFYGDGQSAEQLLKTVGMQDAANRRLDQLSAGMYQRIGIALAFAGNPRLVFLDEPTSNLDIESRDRMLDLIVDENRESGVSFFISSHILSELERVCHNVAFINQGRILEDGPVQELIEKYTAGRYRVRSSDANRLLNGIKGISHLDAAEIRGSTSVIVSVREEHLEEVLADIRRAADFASIKIYGVEPACTLEDTFREVMRLGPTEE